MGIAQAVSTLLKILFWFLKRKPEKDHSNYDKKLELMDKALASGDDDYITLAFERLHRESSGGGIKRHDGEV